MTTNKTQPNNKSVTEFLNSIPDEKKRADSFEIMHLMQEITGETPEMWGDSIVGYGRYRYQYASGRQGEWFLVGFSPRKQNLTLYIMSGFDNYHKLLNNLGKHKTGKSCLYIKRLDDINRETLTELIRQSVAHMQATNES
ncbi:MAG: DUF1801 domain-containing protein [Chloroflexi bacterium]|nr:MAG: DUF1801 domain-containing protein [Chloroflexota bacterium]